MNLSVKIILNLIVKILNILNCWKRLDMEL